MPAKIAKLKPLFKKVQTRITSQKMKFSTKDFFNKCDQIRSFLRIWSHLLRKSFMENFIFCTVNPKHYRPISVLAFVSNVLQRVIDGQTMRFLDKHKVLYKFQTGFRKNHSTDIYLSYLTNKISNGFDSALPTGMVSIELQKTFDIKDHNILMQKMLSLGFANEAI